MALLNGCVSVERNEEELLPSQFNHSDSSGLNLVVLTESILVERDYSGSKHRRVSKFPPHFILFFSADREFAGQDVEISDALLRGPRGFSRRLMPQDAALRLKPRSEETPGEYQNYTQLKYQGGDKLVRAIFFSERISEIVVGETYKLVLTYVSLDGSKVNLEIDYKARRNRAWLALPNSTHLPPT